MRTIPLTQFRQHACELFTEVEGGETIEITRHASPQARSDEGRVSGIGRLAGGPVC